MKFLLLVGLVLLLRTQSSQVQAFATTSHSSPLTEISGKMAASSSSSALHMARTRGLERREEGATPLRKFSLFAVQLQDFIIDALFRCGGGDSLI